MSDYYILDKDHNVIGCDLMQWSEQFCQSRRSDIWRVALDSVAACDVSTVFLGLDSGYSFLHKGAPLRVFETMLFSEGDCEVMHRYATWSEAEEGHRTLVDSLRVLEAESVEMTRAMLSIVRGGLQHHMKAKK